MNDKEYKEQVKELKELSFECDNWESKRVHAERKYTEYKGLKKTYANNKEKAQKKLSNFILTELGS